MSDLAEISVAASPADMPAVRALFEEYERSAHAGLGACFEEFARELAGLPGDYAPPAGRILLASSEEAAVGVVGLRPLAGRSCEIKRLFVRPAARGRGLGRALVERALGEADTAGYRTVRLETHETMDAAIALYRGLGFREISSYAGREDARIISFERPLG
ncbi:MAG: GNAT family N-acetyltransferase [Proteobacteria bacterium]|nr:GNAT family N-acetyltransferase [Pseudomonadota bacterium]